MRRAGAGNPLDGRAELTGRLGPESLRYVPQRNPQCAGVKKNTTTRLASWLGCPGWRTADHPRSRARHTEKREVEPT